MTYEHKWIFPAKITEDKQIYDADTIKKVIVDKGFDSFHKSTIRFHRINAYEVKLRKGTTPAQKKKGLEGRKYLRELLVGKDIYIRTIKGGSKKGKFGRYLGEVYILSSDELYNTLITCKTVASNAGYKKYKIDGLINLNDLMVAKGFAIYKRY